MHTHYVIVYIYSIHKKSHVRRTEPRHPCVNRKALEKTSTPKASRFPSFRALENG